MVESSRLVFKLLCEKLKSLNFELKMYITSLQFSDCDISFLFLLKHRLYVLFRRFYRIPTIYIIS